MARVALATVVLVLATAVAGNAYVNPTPGAQVALQIPGMEKASVLRDVVYARSGGAKLLLDVYRPPGAGLAKRLPAVLLVHGTTSDSSPKNRGVYVGWGQLLAASGLAGIPFDNRGTAADVRAALAFVRRNAAGLGVDSRRICIASFSAGVPIGLGVALADGHLRCALAFYGSADPAPLTKNAPPTFMAEAGLDDPANNEAIDRYVARARKLGAPVTLAVHPTGQHGFDALDHDARSRAIIREALRFARSNLRLR